MEKKFNSRTQGGFTLVEVLLVVVILAVISSITIPKVSGSGDKARLNADIATARQVQAALDRYQVENGIYPKYGELVATNGEITVADAAADKCDFIPEYISKLDSTVTQQRVEEGGPVKGFGLSSGDAADTSTSNMIMIYLKADGSKAEVRAYKGKDGTQIWPKVLTEDSAPPKEPPTTEG